MSDDNKIILSSVFIAITFIFLLIFVGYKVNEYKCDEKSKLMEVNNYYSISTGCMVKYKSNWIPLNQVREF